MSYFLERIEAIRYGALTARSLGPFGPGLNVVYGGNEAGKTTMASLVPGVLFGWGGPSGILDGYQPPCGERSGCLVFSRRERVGNADRPLSVMLKRTGDATEGPSEILLPGDVSSSTYRSLFFLAAGVPADGPIPADGVSSLFAAGFGAASGPVWALAEVERQLAAHVSQAEDAQQSVVHLNALLDRKRAQVAAASQEQEVLRQQGRDLRELEESRQEVTKRIEEAQGDLESLRMARTKLESIRLGLGRLQDEEAQLQRERDAVQEASAERGSLSEELVSMDAIQERALRERLDDLGESRDKARRVAEGAKQNSAASQAAYEAFLEMDDQPPSLTGRLRAQTSHAVVAIVPTLAFIAAGIPLFIHGRQINSLSFTAFGVALILLAFLLAAAAVISLLRPSRSEDAIGERRKDAQWVMLQDQKKLAGALAEAEAVERRIADFLGESGLSQADGSLRQARALLDEAAEIRSRRAAAAQRLAALDLRVQAANDERERLRAEAAPLAALLPAASMASEGELPGVEDYDEALRVKSAQIQALAELGADLDRRQGELARQLEEARDDSGFDRVKLDYEQLQTLLHERKHELVELLLAKRILEHSLAAWEGRNQPRIHRLAGRLLETITDGQWTQVQPGPDGSVAAKDAQGRTVEFGCLSSVTRQQLQLAVRIALLLSDREAGESLPVLVDDILADYDERRRRGAAKVLGQLAHQRQVIVFTSQKDTIQVLQAVDPALTVLSL